MGLVLAALRRPFTVIVLVLGIVVAAGLSMRRAPADIFPALNVPVIYVVQPYAGMSPRQMESQLVSYYEYHFLYVAGIARVESQSIQGIGVVKLTFHPGTDAAQALAQVVAMADRSRAFMPQGTLPPFIVRFDAGSIPIAQLVFSSPTRSEADVQDLALNSVRPLLATLPGVSAPPPSGGKVRTIVGTLDPMRLRAYGITPDEVATAVARANVVLPAGNLREGDITRIVETDALLPRPPDLLDVPLRVAGESTVYLRDVARVEDGADIVYNVALVDGRRTVYMPVTKRADASTLDVARAVREALPRMRELVPEDVRIDLEFDQSGWVSRSIASLVEEGVLGAVLTSLVVLLFLRDLRSALIVVLTIPTSVLSAFVALRLFGETVNIMTLGGLALSVGILVDEATVAIENIHAHLERGTPKREAVVVAMREVMVPRLLAMLCVVSVFLPALFVTGIAASLFPPLALAVGFAMASSYLISSTLVPVLSVWISKEHHRVRPPGSLRAAYARVVRALVRARFVVLPLYLAICAAPWVLLSDLPSELFPRVDAGQLKLRLRAPAGTRIERTTELVRALETIVRSEAGDGNVTLALANIGTPAWTFPVNAVYAFNSGPHEATLLVALRDGDRESVFEIADRVRDRVRDELPDVRVSFEAGDVVSEVMNYGAATPIRVDVSGADLRVVRHFAERVAGRLATRPELRDVQIPQALDYPTVRVEIDRDRAGQLGITADTIARSVLTATSSSVLTSPLFWTDPKSGQPYRIALRVPEASMQSVEDLESIPVGGSAQLREVADAIPSTSYGEVARTNNQRTVSVTANLAGRDLAEAARIVRAELEALGDPPRGLRVAVRGQVEQLEQTLVGLREGMLLSIAVVALLLVASFQAVREPVAVIATTPAVLGGVLAALWLSDTSLNVQSMMGAVMSIGISIANAVLLVSFYRDRRRDARPRDEAVIEAAVGRLRPIVMTSAAMIAGMIPMALAVGGGADQNAPLGIAVIGGLAASLLATLIALPAALAVLGSTRPWRSASLVPEVHPEEEA